MNKTAVITGSARGLGFEMAKRFLAHKYNVSICDVNKDALKKAEAELKKLAPKKGMVLATPCDVTKLEDLEKLWAASAKAFGEVDVWVNNAGVNQPMVPLWDLKQKTIDLLVDIDLKGAIYGSKVAIAHMKEQGHGCVYCIEGFGADDATQLGLTAYGASKKGVQYLVRGLATELKKTGTPVQVGRLNPGIMITNFITHPLGDGKEMELEERTKKVHQIEWEEGQHTEEKILNADEIIKSPGIPDTAPMIQKVMEKGIHIISEIEFAGRYTNSKMICITGSNGKTTTTSLIYHIFKDAGYDVGLAGNIGNSLALQVAEDPHEYYVIELSSFQLDNMYDFRADIAILLNITPDHLDRYNFEMQNYVDAKMRIIQNQTPKDAFIYWADDPIIKRELEKYDIKAIQYPFSELKEKGVIGYIEEGQYKIEEPTPFNMEQESLSLTGKHNIYNSLAAGIAADIAGIKKEEIRKCLSDFPGVEHRLEKVCVVRGVQYINDSKATNVDACWYALEAMKTKVILIIGGKDKGNDYEPIKPLVKEKCSGLVYLGADNKKLHDNFDGMGIPVRDTHSMKECIEACYEMAQPGETVLLSPCCASFDLFKNMEDRGEQFKTLAKNL